MSSTSNWGPEGPGPQRETLLAAETTRGKLCVIRSTLGPFCPGWAWPQLAETSLACYVLEGLLALSLGEEAVVLHAGEIQFVPSGLAHRYWNPTPAPTRLLLIYTPVADHGELYRLGLMGGQPQRDPWDAS